MWGCMAHEIPGFMPLTTPCFPYVSVSNPAAPTIRFPRGSRGKQMPRAGARQRLRPPAAGENAGLGAIMNAKARLASA